MGEVYLAHDARLGRDVAVKVLPEAFHADPDRIIRFEREAKMLAALNHPHIAALLSMEEAHGRHFLVMELVEGQTLAELLQHGPPPLSDRSTSSARLPMRSLRRTSRASSTAISSRPISRSVPTAP